MWQRRCCDSSGQKITPDEEKLLKGILNTEAVAAFVPPGGSDILETP